MDFTIFSMTHLVTLGLIVFISVFIFRFRYQLDERFRYFLGLLMLSLELGYHAWAVLMGQWSIAYSLPFQLCSMSIMLCLILIFTEARWAFEIVYFTGLGGASMALITPDLFYDFPHFRFFHFFINHAAILWTIFYFTWTKGYRPTYRSLWKTIGYLNIYMILIYGLNILVGGNYLFLIEKPAAGSLLDVMGPHPWYILSLEGVTILLFHLLYLPHPMRKA